MPLYEYYCEENEKTIEVRHGMSETVDTWKKLCDLASMELGETPGEAVVKRVISGGMSLPRRKVGEAKAPAVSGGHTGGCSCC
ncbi:zinc ribbon domain-containing protein [Candidatus Uabimicrobium amorphum]|uniref:Zinc ribbon domain-containing protein n=1 Tax=Uabimicrobium amorphum TaxID=2596890 RepID=A0A5S9IKB1_UABAM|nr:zinc ribbon domain-containing protein [Candidatus Uabimicrobium amorphum]BBM83026.1 hypothetical protein UABAM_01369 [Candidatus Uabimicrobium amorphum]